MKTNVPRTIPGALAVLGLTMGLMAAAPNRAAMDHPVPAGSNEQALSGSMSWTGFRVDVTTDKKVYTSAETALLTVRLLNESSFSVYVGIGPDEPTFPAQTANDTGTMATLSVPIGYVLVTQLGQDPIICTQTIQPDGTVIDTCPQNRRYPLSLFRSNRVSGHSTQVISTLEIPLGSGPWFDPGLCPGTDPEDADLCIPLPPGHYLLDCHIDGICGVPEAHAQQIIEIGS